MEHIELAYIIVLGFAWYLRWKGEVPQSMLSLRIMNCILSIVGLLLLIYYLVLYIQISTGYWFETMSYYSKVQGFAWHILRIIVELILFLMILIPRYSSNIFLSTFVALFLINQLGTSFYSDYLIRYFISLPFFSPETVPAVGFFYSEWPKLIMENTIYLIIFYFLFRYFKRKINSTEKEIDDHLIVS